MAVSKRLRYEILRRDNHACRYCGKVAPDVELRVDHVVPVALGGSDDPSNLVAACEPCNTGKSSSSPDAALVADISADAFRWNRAMKEAAEFLLAEFREREDLRERFLAKWNQWTTGSSYRPQNLPLDAGWRHSIDNFMAAGLPLEMLFECVDAAMAAKHVTPENTFRYMCGIAWKKVGELREVASALVHADQPQQDANPITGEATLDPADRTVEQALRDWQGRDG